MGSKSRIDGMSRDVGGGGLDFVAFDGCARREFGARIGVSLG